MPARFSYINAKGKEVEIGGTAQLMQRIRLGAIVDSTQLYDAASDRWAPAAEHPIYEELAATVEFEELAASVDDDDAEAAPATDESIDEPDEIPVDIGEEEEEEVEEEEVPAAVIEEEPVTEEPPEAEVVAEDEGGFETVDFGLTVSGESEGEEEGPEEGGEGEPGFDLGGGPAAMEEEEEEGEGEEEEGAAVFDFGAEPLELEEGPEEEEEVDAAGDSGMDLESPLDHIGVGEGQGAGGEFGGGELVTDVGGEDWARDEEEDSWEMAVEEEPEPSPAMEVEESPLAGESEGEDDTSQKRARPDPRRRRESSNSISVVTLVFILALLGGGGWAGYTYLLGGSGGESSQDLGRGPDPRLSRTVPAELAEPMASSADQAAAEVSSWVDQIGEAQGVAERPPEEWLDGIYLAHASRYSAVAEYFTSLQAFVEEVRGGASRRFLEAYDRALGEADLSEEELAQVRGWAQEDLEWSQFKRDSVYGAMLEVTGAALDLHQLLVDREADIGYELLEAVPADAQLQGQIDGHVDRITESLDELDALGRVTPERFGEIVVSQLRESLSPS